MSILVPCLQKLCTFASYFHFALTFQGDELLMRPEEGNAACPSSLCPLHRLIYLAGPPWLPVLSPGPSGDWMDKACDGSAFVPIMAYLLQLPFFVPPYSLWFYPSLPQLLSFLLSFAALLSATHPLMAEDSGSSWTQRDKTKREREEE